MIRKIHHRVKKGWAEIALLSAEMIIVLVVFVIALVAFVFITRNVFILKNEEFDHKVFAFLEPYVTSSRNSVVLFFTFLGTHIFLIPANILLIIYFLFIRRHRWYSIKVPVISLSSLALMFILKNAFGRHRPDIPLLKEASGLSFPSGHALMSVTFYGLIIHIVWNTVKKPWLKWTVIILLILLILVIGFTRIYLRVHYPSDVFAGFATGFLWLVSSIWAIDKIEKYTRQKASQLVQ
jgi:undecaprenyl-diphosphatase